MKPSVNDFIEARGELYKIVSIDIHDAAGNPLAFTCAAVKPKSGRPLARIMADEITSHRSRTWMKRWYSKQAS